MVKKKEKKKKQVMEMLVNTRRRYPRIKRTRKKMHYSVENEL